LLRGALQVRAPRPSDDAARSRVLRREEDARAAARGALACARDDAVALGRESQGRRSGADRPRRHDARPPRASGHRRSLACRPRSDRHVACHDRPVALRRRGKRSVVAQLVPARGARRSRAHLPRAHAGGHVPLPLPRPRDDDRHLRRSADQGRMHVRAGDLRAHGRDELRDRAVKTLRVLLNVVMIPVCWLLARAAITPLPEELRAREYEESITFVDRNGAVLREVRASDATRARWVPLEEAGPWVPAAIVAAEDARFDRHLGVDPIAVVRAIGQAVVHRRIVSGASTLTMQLARIVRPHPKNARGKFDEMALALRIEASLSKDEILEAYMNRAPFGP